VSRSLGRYKINLGAKLVKVLIPRKGYLKIKYPPYVLKIKMGADFKIKNGGLL
jgi:hypothetical protein